MDNLLETNKEQERKQIRLVLALFSLIIIALCALYMCCDKHSQLIIVGGEFGVEFRIGHGPFERPVKVNVYSTDDSLKSPVISDVYVEYKDEMDLALKLSEAAKEHFDKIMEMINKVLLENEKLWQRIDRDMKDWNSLE